MGRQKAVVGILKSVDQAKDLPFAVNPGIPDGCGLRSVVIPLDDPAIRIIAQRHFGRLLYELNGRHLRQTGDVDSSNRGIDVPSRSRKRLRQDTRAAYCQVGRNRLGELGISGLAADRGFQSRCKKSIRCLADEPNMRRII